ncbi:pirin family protein [Cognaticolwellia beringensis]|uniref:Pirin family protein n=1 Tax=Cognaticolwellia beringensis TaxID=1967665 RepID=A0A222G6Y8_9GAMM|nr:pirin-like bicupin family protein [Cognaticolwellia beringensis]ASP47645.1 pirin family protein [Cognaticolwellia beringensis]
MIKHYPFQQLGKAKHGWLTANHHFSFAQYYNPRRMGFGHLRVINDDWIAPNTGFPEHPHKNMEIITFIRSGAITHQDSRGNQGVTSAGEVQVMSAGKGIRHSEYNHSNKPTTLFQIWIEPNKQNVAPRWDSMKYPKTVNNSSLPMVVSGYEEDRHQTLFIQQQARIFAGKINKGVEVEHEITHQAYVIASQGAFTLVDGKQSVNMAKGDGAEITQQKFITIKALKDSEIIIIDTP